MRAEFACPSPCFAGAHVSRELSGGRALSGLVSASVVHPLRWQGNSPRNIQSGLGIVHNGCLYKRIQKSVVRGTWEWPGYVPFWIHDNFNGRRLCHAAADFFAYPTFVNFVLCALNALGSG